MPDPQSLITNHHFGKDLISEAYDSGGRDLSGAYREGNPSRPHNNRPDSPKTAKFIYLVFTTSTLPMSRTIPHKKLRKS